MNIISKLTSNPEVMAFIQENESDSLAYVNQNLRVSDIYDNIKSDMGKYVVEGDLDATYANIKSYARDYTINVMEESSFGDKVKGLWNKIPATLAATGIVTGAAAITAVTVAKFNESFANIFKVAEASGAIAAAEVKRFEEYFKAAQNGNYEKMESLIKLSMDKFESNVEWVKNGFNEKLINNEQATRVFGQLKDVESESSTFASNITKVWSNINAFIKQHPNGHVISGLALLLGLLSIVYVRNKIKDSRK